MWKDNGVPILWEKKWITLNTRGRDDVVGKNCWWRWFELWNSTRGSIGCVSDGLRNASHEWMVARYAVGHLWWASFALRWLHWFFIDTKSICSRRPMRFYPTSVRQAGSDRIFLSLTTYMLSASWERGEKRRKLWEKEPSQRHKSSGSLTTLMCWPVRRCFPGGGLLKTGPFFTPHNTVCILLNISDGF